MNYHSDEWTMAGLQRHFEEVLKVIPKERIVAIILRGSQNYGLDYEKSDIDSRCIYIPTLDEIRKYPHWVEKYVLTVGHEQIAMIDIRLFTYALERRSLYYIEALYSKWVIVPNQQYEYIWNIYTNIANDLVKSNKPALAASILYYANDYTKIVTDNFYVNRREVAYRKGYDSKALYQMTRCHLLMQLLLTDRPFSYCMNEQLNELARAAKEGQYEALSAHWLNRFLLADINRIYNKIN